MSKKHDGQFLNLVSIVIGGLIGLAVGIFVVASYIGRHAGGGRDLDDPQYVKEVTAHTAPVGRVAVAGQDNKTLAIVGTAVAAVKAATVSTEVLGGADVYKSVCAMCHAAGIGGAPKFGDKAAWGPRLAQGAATLHQHALAGYTGKAGVMPAKGGRADLSDQSVTNAVDYIASAAK